MLLFRGSRRHSLLLLAWTSLLILHITPVVSSEKCSTGQTFYCPNCGGVELSDCLDCEGYVTADTKDNICVNRKLFQPHNTDPTDPDNYYRYLWMDLVGMVVWFVCAGVATACGVGGGGIYVPLGILLLQFAPKQASGLSQASIFGASLGGLALNIRNRHPQKLRSDAGHTEGKRHLQTKLSKTEEEHYVQEGGEYFTRPLINYDMALFLAPMEMAGAVLGVLVQRILPNWLYLLIAGLVLSFTSYKTYKKYFATRSKETQERRRAREEEAEATAAAQHEEENKQEQPEEQAPVPQGDTGSSSDSTDEEGQTKEEEDEEDATTNKKNEEEPSTVDKSKKDDEEHCPNDDNDVIKKPNQDDDKLQRRIELLKQDQRQYPREKLVALLILWVGLFLLTLLKGGKGVESLVGITCESPWYAVLIVLQFLWIFGFAIYFGRKLLVLQRERVEVEYPYLEDDPTWDWKSLRFYGLFTFIAGVVAGLIGIGGGMVLGPLMLVMGIHPRVSSATTATMIVLTSSSVAVIFVTSGLVPWSYAVFYFFVCLSGAYIGKSYIDGYIKKSGRASLLILILATIIAFATMGCFVILFTRLADKNWCLDGFNKFCTTKDGTSCGRMLLEAFLMKSEL